MNHLFKAIEFSAKAHDHQYRKTTEVPYISHPYSVGLILMKEGCTEDVIVSGILHDVIEDTHVSYEDLVTTFGSKVAEIVTGCSEPDKTLSWEERKKHTISYLKDAPIEVKLVACADKIHNLTSIEHSLAEMGPIAWDRFNRGKEDQEWYYRSLMISISHNFNQHKDLVIRLQEKIEQVFSY